MLCRVREMTVKSLVHEGCKCTFQFGFQKVVGKIVITYRGENVGDKLGQCFHTTVLLADLSTQNSVFINCYFIGTPTEHAMVRTLGNSKISCYSKCCVRNIQRKWQGNPLTYHRVTTVFL